MFKRIKRALDEYIITLVSNRVAIGGHCGLCGKWVKDVLVPVYWRITICEDCSKGKK